MSNNQLIKIFNAEKGIISFVGAGGKKSAMFRLAAEHEGRVAITATAHIEFFPKNLDATNYIGDEDALLSAIHNDSSSKTIAFAKPSSRFGRRAGIKIDMVKRFYEEGNFDLMLIKADGARGKFIKAPSEQEPALSPESDIVVPVLSAHVIGESLTNKLAHRPEILSEITGVGIGEEIKPVHVARLLASEAGLLKNTGNKTVIPLINMVDDEELKRFATLAAEQALQLTNKFNQVILASMKKEQAIVDVVK